eukprot:6917831-Lingulodinium_polyedra.AAC.1
MKTTATDANGGHHIPLQHQHYSQGHRTLQQRQPPPERYLSVCWPVRDMYWGNVPSAHGARMFRAPSTRVASD